MKSTKKEKVYSKKYYATHKDYREDKIEKRKKYAKAHKDQEANYARKYYAENDSYRKKKKEYARNYKRKHHNKK